MIRIIRYPILIIAVFVQFIECKEIPVSSNQTLSPDGQVIKQLKNAGSDLSKEHPIEFFIYVPTRISAKKISSILLRNAYKSKIKKSTKGMWSVIAVKNIIPKEKVMLQIRDTLTALASSEGGEYNGWGTPIIR